MLKGFVVTINHHPRPVTELMGEINFPLVHRQVITLNDDEHYTLPFVMGDAIAKSEIPSEHISEVSARYITLTEDDLARVLEEGRWSKETPSEESKDPSPDTTDPDPEPTPVNQ